MISIHILKESGISNTKYFLALFLLGIVLLGSNKPAVALTHNVLLVRPAATARYYEGRQTDKTFYSPWSIYRDDILSGPEYNVDEYAEYEIPSNLSKYDLIVLPDVICLDDKQWKPIKEYIMNGGGVFASSGFGSRAIDGSWRGYKYLKDVFGVEPVSLMADVEVMNTVQIRYGEPGSLSVSPGFYLHLNQPIQPLFIPRGSETKVIGYWSRDAYEEVDPETITRNVAFAAKELGIGGRFAWTGFTLNEISRDSINSKAFHAIFSELFHWLAGEAVVGIAPWPTGKRSAVLINGDIEDQFYYVSKVCNLLNRYPFKSTFNLLTDEAKKYPEVVKVIAASKAELSIHGNHHAYFWGTPADLQAARIKIALDYVNQYGARSTGFRPPQLAYDQNTFIALRRNNLEFISADRNPESEYPRWVPDSVVANKFGGFVLFPKGELDDYDLFVKLGLNDPNIISHMIELDLLRKIDLGGYYQFGYHSQYLRENKLLIGIEQMLNRLLTMDSVWVAPARDITRWVRQRQGAKLTAESGLGVIKVTVNNCGSENITGADLVIIPPSRVSFNSFLPADAATRAKCSFSNGTIYYHLPQLEPGVIIKSQFGKY